MAIFAKHIQPAFKNHELIEIRENSNTYIIKNSETLLRKIATKMICSANYCPIFSDNRTQGNLIFTVVPFRKNEDFICKDNNMDKEDLWKSIESTLHQFNAGEPVIIQQKLVYEDSLMAQKEMFCSCTQTASLMIDFFHDAPNKGKVLDLGCGLGANSISLLAKGWNVVAMDISSDVLELYKKTALENKLIDRLKLVHTDITTQEFGKDQYDAVICIDTIPYIDSKKIQTLMGKIQSALKTNGKLFGTLFFRSPNTEAIQEMLEKLGGHFYEGSHIAPALLRNTGFSINMCSLLIENPNGVEFIGTKN